MKIVFYSLVLTTILCAAGAQAEEFYVELGRERSEQAAQSSFRAMQEAHPVLADYDVFPNQILQPDGSFSFRVQAGPMLSKSEAQGVCHKLSRKSTPCYVVEGFDPKHSGTFADKSQPLPRMLSQKEFMVLPWLADGGQQAAVESGVAVASVGEAIQVPVTEEATQVSVGSPVAVAEVPSIVINENVIPSFRFPTPEPGVAGEPVGWVTVQPFLDEERAKSYWERTKKDLPQGYRSLEAKVIRPVVSDIPKVVLALGTFTSESEAEQFCRAYVPAATYLECNFVNRPPQAVQEKMQEEAEQRADDAGLFWAELLSESSQDRALERWEEIRTRNDDVLYNVRSQISASLADPGVYVVKVGPLESRSKAEKLCETLRSRKVGCTLAGL